MIIIIIFAIIIIIIFRFIIYSDFCRCKKKPHPFDQRSLVSRNNLSQYTSASSKD